MDFEFHGALKPVSTGFVGTSPAFELSLYTLAFLCGQEETLCELGGVATAIHVHRHRGDQDWHLSSRGGRAPGHGRPFVHISCTARMHRLRGPQRRTHSVPAVNRVHWSPYSTWSSPVRPTGGVRP